MSGLILLAAVVVSVWLCVWLSKTIGNWVPNVAWRSTVKVGVFLALLAAPFVDELIGMYQFNVLCKANGIEGADVSKARGKRVKVEYGERKFLAGTIMPIKVSDVLFRDADTSEVLIQHKNYYAMGGWLMRYTPLSMGSQHPMLFSGNGCDQRPLVDIFQRNSTTFLYK